MVSKGCLMLKSKSPVVAAFLVKTPSAPLLASESAMWRGTLQMTRDGMQGAGTAAGVVEIQSIVSESPSAGRSVAFKTADGSSSEFVDAMVLPCFTAVFRVCWWKDWKLGWQVAYELE